MSASLIMSSLLVRRRRQRPLSLSSYHHHHRHARLARTSPAWVSYSSEGRNAKISRTFLYILIETQIR